MDHGGVGGAGRVRRVGHALSQVSGAVQRVCGRPLLKGLLAIKEHELKGDGKFLTGEERESD